MILVNVSTLNNFHNAHKKQIITSKIDTLTHQTLEKEKEKKIIIKAQLSFANEQ